MVDVVVGIFDAIYVADVVDVADVVNVADEVYVVGIFDVVYVVGVADKKTVVREANLICVRRRDCAHQASLLRVSNIFTSNIQLC